MSKSPTFTGQVRDVFHQDTPAQGRHLAAHLIQRLPACPIPEIARLGRTLRKWKDALDAYFDTDGASNAPHRSHQRNHQTRQTHRQRLPQPHQLQTPNAPHRRRPRRLHPHSTLKSPQIRAIKDSIGHVEVFQIDGVAIAINGRHRPLPGHDTPNPAHNTYTLEYKEPDAFRKSSRNNLL